MEELILNQKKYKNKFEITWEYIWRFLLATIIGVAIGFVLLKIVSFIITKNNVLIVTNGDLIIRFSNLQIVYTIIKAIIYSLSISVGWGLIHKDIRNRFESDFKMLRYASTTVGILSSLIMIGIVILFFFVNPLSASFGLNNQMTIKETREALIQEVNAATKAKVELMDSHKTNTNINVDGYNKAMELLNTGIYDVDSVIRVLVKNIIIAWILAFCVLIETVVVININHKKIKEFFDRSR